MGASRAFVQYSYEETVKIRQELGGIARNDLPGYTTRILDGNHLSKTDHRLKETRDLQAGPLPGKSLVVYDPRYDALADVIPIEDGHAQERSELDQVLEIVLAKQLWIADRNFCTLQFLYRSAAQGAFWAIRQDGQLPGKPVGKLRKIGTTETGDVYEQKFRLSGFEGKTLTVRRVVVHLFQPTRDQDFEIAVLTNLPAADAKAVEVSELYRTRWKLETLFLHITNTMNCEVPALCYPKAALFCFCLALLAYNALSIVKGVLAIEKGREEAEQLSHFYMVLEISETTDGMLVAIEDAEWEPVANLTARQFATEIRRIAKGIDMTNYRKSPQSPKKPSPPKKKSQKQVHVSTARILAKRKEKAC